MRLNENQGYYEVHMTSDIYEGDPTDIMASSVDISDEDGTARFVNHDSSTNSTQPVYFFPRSTYTYILYAGSA